jgi:HlyD family secretion protein
MRKQIVLLVFILRICTACKNKGPVAEDPTVVTQTPVTITGISRESLEDSIELNAISGFLLKNYVKSNSTGYLQTSAVIPGQFVNTGQTLFTIRTKEAESIGNAINKLDTSFKFSGTNSIKAGSGGYISQVNHQPGDYVQDGEQLAVISDAGSFVFLLDLPYELIQYVRTGNHIYVQLPDGEKIPGVISSYMPTVDAASQTQSIVIKVNTGHPIPENLIAKVKIPRTVRTHTTSLPKACILSDETQSEFWVMKLADSATAVKVNVKKGIETSDRVEIISPVFSTEDKFLLTGNYGLGDTAKVKIIQP